MSYTLIFFCKQLGSGLITQSCLHFEGSELLNGCNRRQRRRSGVFIVNFVHTVSSVSTADFEQVNVTWTNAFLLETTVYYILVKIFFCL